MERRKVQFGVKLREGLPAAWFFEVLVDGRVPIMCHGIDVDLELLTGDVRDSVPVMLYGTICGTVVVLLAKLCPPRESVALFSDAAKHQDGASERAIHGICDTVASLNVFPELLSRELRRLHMVGPFSSVVRVMHVVSLHSSFASL